MDESDLRKAAELLIRRHGSEAETRAVERSKVMRDKGWDDGAELWVKISEVVREIQQDPGPPG
jgi:hypothetical protein